MGNYYVLGDYLLAPTNGGIFKVLMSDIEAINPNYTSPSHYAQALCDVINDVMDGSFVTGNGLNSITYFDNWTKTDLGKPKITPSTDNPYKYDHVMFIWRNRSGYNGTGRTSGGGFYNNILGFEGDTHSNIGTYNRIPTQVARHEYAHQLFGGNDFHSAGGGWGSPYDYWIPRTGGWSVLGLSGSSLQCCNAWDRQRMDWKLSGNNYNPAARNANNTAEVNGDLDATDPGDAGTYTLRDFITTGDAIRIKLPFTDPNNEFPEYLWIENHVGAENNNSPFDKWQYEDNSCVDPFIPGMMVFIQIDKDIRESGDKWEIYGGHADYTRPLTAEGNFDRSYETNTVFNDCVQWGNTWAFTKGLPNPLTGGCDQDMYTVDVDNDDIIEKGDIRANHVELINGTYYKHLYTLGHSSHVFTLGGNNKVGIATNPPSASKMNMVSYDWPPPPGMDNLRKIYLNGVSIEIINCDIDHNLKLQIHFDDVDIDTNVRWCADEIILSPVNTTSGYSLNLKSGKTLLLDQGTSATRMDNPVLFNGKEIFVSTTLFRCTANTVFKMESNSTLQLDNSSTLQLEPESVLDVGEEATVDLRNNSKIIVQSNSTLTFKSGSTLYLTGNSELLVESGGHLVFEDGVNVYGNTGDKITVNGDIQISYRVTFQKKEGGDDFTGLILSNSELTTNMNLVTFNEAGLENYGEELTVVNSDFINCEFFNSFVVDITIGTCDFYNSSVTLVNQSASIAATVTVDNCSFTSTQGENPAIGVWSYNNFLIENNTITGYYSGIQLWQSGEGASGNQNLYNNEIYNSTMSGIMLFNSTASISSNYLHNNFEGLSIYDNCNVALYGNPGAETYDEVNYITNNDSYEVYASTGSFPWYFRNNAIIDEDNLGNPTDPMVYYEPPTGGFPLIDVKYNCWGNNFDPFEDLYPSGYMVNPTWCPGGGGQKSSEVALQTFLDGEEHFKNEEYADAKTTFESVIELYPNTQYAGAAMKELFALEKFTDNDYSTLKQYFETNDSIQADTILTKLAVFLSNKCEIELENWQTAIDHFEDVIDNPESAEDSIFAIIDLGYTYLLMGDSTGRDLARGRMLQYVPKSREEFAARRNYLLSLLPVTKNQQKPDNLFEISKAGVLSQNAPNPFTNTTTVYYKLTEQGSVTLKVFDHVGREVKKINEKYQHEGLNKVKLDMNGLPSGIYFYSIFINGQLSDTKKMVLM